MTEPAPKRRLPVLQNTDDDIEVRPAWHWVGLGACATLLGWLLLANIGNAIVGALARDAEAGESSLGAGVVLLATNLAALALAAFGGGALVGRFGGVATAREAALAGLVAALFACAVAALGSGAALSPIGWIAAIVIVGGIGALAALLGGRRGVRARKGGRVYVE